MAKNNGDHIKNEYSIAQSGDEFELDEGWDAKQLGVIQPRFTAGELVDHLIHNPDPVTGRDLYAFSDLSRHDAESVRRDWDAIPLDRRRAVVQNLIDLAENDLDWHLGRILRIAMQDQDPTVRRTAIEGLWEETSSDLLGPLVDAVRHDADETVRAAAAAALGNYVLAGELDEMDAALAMRAEQALLEILRNGEEPIRVQSRALESLAFSGETGVRQLIEDAYYSPHEALRVSALVAMGRSADVHWRSYVRAELQSPSAAMRAEAARASGELEARSAVHDLIQLLTDDAQSVRLAAIFALGRIGGKEAREALRIVSSEGDQIEAEAADEALEEILFYSESQTISLYDEEEADDDDDGDRWDFDDDDELGEYER
jgi:HEAT repeat protein